MKTIGQYCNFHTTRLPYPYDYFNEIEDYDKSINTMELQKYYANGKGKKLNDEEKFRAYLELEKSKPRTSKDLKMI